VGHFGASANNCARRWVVLAVFSTVAYTQYYMEVDWAAADETSDDGVTFQWTKLLQEGLMPSFGTFCVSFPLCLAPYAHLLNGWCCSSSGSWCSTRCTLGWTLGWTPPRRLTDRGQGAVRVARYRQLIPIQSTALLYFYRG
jgi:hypothetical protein